MPRASTRAGAIGFLGNTGQHLLFYDLATLEEVDRVSTLRFEVPDTTIKGSTHLVWLDDTQFVTAIGEHLWRFDVNRLTKAEVVAPHGLKVPHAMKQTASGRYIVYGGMDHPARGEAREVGILDTVTGEVRTRAAADDLLARRVPPGPRRLLRDLLPGPPGRPVRLRALGHGVAAAVRLRDRRRAAARCCATGPPTATCRPTSTPT